MSRGSLFLMLSTSLVAMSSCCCTEQGNHSVRKMWADYNTLRCPAFYLEQEDHLPYPAAQVGYYRWMYDKDPGHQLACLGPIPPKTCPNCDPVPPGNEPFEYEVYFPTGVPRQSDQLWGNRLPEPINLPGSPRTADQGRASGGALAQMPAKNNLVPVTPIPPPAEPKAAVAQPAPVESRPSNTAAPTEKPSPLPSFDLQVPSPKPVDESPPPLLGPAAQKGPNLRLTTDQSLPSGSAAIPSPDAVWPR